MLAFLCPPLCKPDGRKAYLGRPVCSSASKIYSRHVPPIAARRIIAPNRATGASPYTPHRFDSERQATEDGSALIISNISAGELYKVDPETGVATLIDVGGVAVNGDGLVRQLTGAYTLLFLCAAVLA